MVALLVLFALIGLGFYLASVADEMGFEGCHCDCQQGRRPCRCKKEDKNA